MQLFFNQRIEKQKENEKEKIKQYFEETTCIHHLIVIDTFQINNAEHELTKRIGHYCKDYNVDFMILNYSNKRISFHPVLNGLHINSIPVLDTITVLSLHNCSMKISNHKTLLCMWNPVPFILKSIDNILSYDGFLSAHSPIIDGFLQSITDCDKQYGYLCTSLPNSLLLPLDDQLPSQLSIFYVGTNWEDSGKRKDTVIRKDVKLLLKLLDQKQMTKIYGPKQYHNNEPWKGYKTYQGPIAFDGKSVITKIKESGICLVLSTAHHIRSEVCSMRIFEGIAAGVPIICDMNPFFQKWFGDTLWYIEGETVDEQLQCIESHIQSIKAHPEDALDKVKKCRSIFTTYFSFDVQFQKIINTIQNKEVITDLKLLSVVK